MSGSTLDLFAARVSARWGPLTSELISDCRSYLEDLLRAPASEEWLASLQRDASESRELYRDPIHGFVLLAHIEAEGRYRPPHDHGRSWVIYGVQHGDMDMGSYARLDALDSLQQLVKRGVTRVRAGEVQVYLPGDIHDTRCISGPALQFRFTERDLRHEKQITRYVEQLGNWVPSQP